VCDGVAGDVRRPLALLQRRRGWPPVDPRDRELARLERGIARLRDQIARQAKVIEVQGNSALHGRPRRAATIRPGRRLDNRGAGL
jgi:hypothetical protein